MRIAIATMLVLLALPLHAAEPAIDKLAFLTGCWNAIGGEPGTEEHWIAPAGGTLFGISRTVRDGKTAAWELMQIREENGAIVFIASPSGQPQATFRLTTLRLMRAVFENPEHDFPQRIVYERRADRLVGRIEGTENGKPQFYEYTFKRGECQ